MFAAVGGQDVPWKLDHSFVMPVNGSNNKFVYMALKDDWRIRADCVRACTSCAMAAAAFKSHWMLCNRMAVHLNLERSPYAKGLAQCKLGYGRNRRTPGNNETNYYVN